MLHPLSLLKKIGRLLIELFWLFYGIFYYTFNKNKTINQRTPSRSHISMIRLFCLTKGYSSDVISFFISLFDKPLPLKNHNGILGHLSKEQQEKINQTLKDEGFYIFENKLPEETLKRLYHYSLNQECTLRPLDGQDNSVSPMRGKFDKHHPKAAVYDLPVDHFVTNHDFQKLITDNSILTVAQNYLKTSPKLDYCGWWWSSAFTKVAQSNSAQLFHFDMDRFKWIKFFIFLTDVTLENGPHVFISKSHKRGHIPHTLLKAGYSRLSDDEVLKYYPAQDVKTFTVPAGTIVAEDTRGLHKGTAVLKDERCVLELQFSNSLFGGTTPSLFNTKLQDQAFLSFAREHGKIYKLYPIFNR